MTYTFKLSRRIARLRAPLFAALLFALIGCENANSFDPSPADGGDSGPATDGPLTSASFAGGIPFGMAAQPLTAFGDRFNGAKLTIGPSLIMEELPIIRSRGGRVVIMLAGSPTNYVDGDGHFSLSKWKARVDRFKGKDLSSYINDGTIVGHFLLDEPSDPRNWNGRPVPASVVEEMAKYSKQLWPAMPAIIRAPPDYMNYNHRYLDAAWAAYLWRRGSASDYLKKSVADAQARGLALVVGMNVLRGGNPNGTGMTPSEVESWGSAMLNSSYPCAFLMWEYNTNYLESSAMRSAMDALRRQAQARSTRTCQRPSSAGGGTPPPPDPPPPDPSPSSGVPFGPYGLPTSEMASFSGSVRGATPSSVLATAAAARQAGTRIVLRLTGTEVTNSDGSFSLTKWKAALDRYAGVNLSSFVSDGTIAGHLLVQNPHRADTWGGRQIPYSTLEEMARYSRQRWPGIPTIVHAPPSWLASKSSPWAYLDAASVMYSGSAGSVSAWIGEQASTAKGARLGLLVGMNVSNGGTSASRLPGTTSGKYAMSASQLQSWGSTLAVQPETCGLVLSRYDAGYFGRSDVKAAVATVAEKARARTAKSCRVRS
jgi:hypothetical protein